MATFPTDKPVKDDEEEVRTKEIDPAKTSDEEDVVRTEEVDLAKTTQEAEDEVRAEEEDKPKEEAIESTTENEESGQGTENQIRQQEDPITTRGSDHTVDLGSTSLTSDQNRRLQEEEETGQGTENQNRQEASITIPRSGQRGSTSSATEQIQDRSLALPNPSSAQMSQAMVPHLGGPSVRPHQHPLGLPQPTWLVVDHFYEDGLGLYGGQWRFRTTTPLHPNQNNTYLLHRLVMMELPHEPAGPVLVAYNQSYGVLQQDRLVPHVGAPPPMRPPMTQQSPSMAQQCPFLSLPPLRIMPPYEQLVVYLGQVPVRPMMYYQEQNQIVPNAAFYQQAPVRPPVTYNQDQIVPSRGQLEAPLWQPPVRMWSPSPIVNAVPVRPMQQQQQFNQGQPRFRFPMNMIQHHQASPSAAAPPPRLQVNQQLPPPTQQQPWEFESQGSNDGPFSSGESEG